MFTILPHQLSLDHKFTDNNKYLNAQIRFVNDDNFLV